MLYTFRDAIEPGHYYSVPELTAARASKFLDLSAATIKGHMDMARNNVRSTKPKKKFAMPLLFLGAAETPQDMQPTKPILERSNTVFAECFPSLVKCIQIFPARSSVRRRVE